MGKYGESDVFKAHTDGAWPGSAVVDGEYQHDAFGDRWSHLTFVVYLNDNFAGGETTFFSPAQGGQRGMYHARSVPAKQGAACVFFHGQHPLSPLHEGSEVTSGTKYII